MPTPRASTTSVKVKDYIMVIGGEEPYSFFSSTEVEAYEVRNNTWKTFPELPLGRYGAGTAVLNDEIYVTCGKRAKREGSDVGDFWKLRIE